MKADKLVCIDADQSGCGGVLVKGEIYTYDGQCVHPTHRHLIYLAEVFALTDEGNRYAFAPNRFRPVDTTYGPAVCERITEMVEYEVATQW